MTKHEEPKPRRCMDAITARLEGEYGCPRRSSEREPLDTLVQTILSQNTNDLNSSRAFESLRKKFPTWPRCAKAPVTGIEAAMRTGGLARQKSRWIKQVLLWVERTFGSFSLISLKQRPTEEALAMLCRLRGVGIKTAAVTMLFGCGRDIFPVDTHVHRVCRRIGLVPQRATAERTFQWMQPSVPKGKGLSLHLNMIRLGREICKAGKPLCPVCPIRTLCDYGKAAMA